MPTQNETDYEEFLRITGGTPTTPAEIGNDVDDDPVQGSPLTGRQRRYSKSLKRQIKVEERRLERLQDRGAPVDAPKTEEHRGIWWLFDKIDRSRNATANTLIAAIRGEKNGAELLNRFWKGLKAEERTEGEDLLEELGVTAKLTSFGAVESGGFFSFRATPAMEFPRGSGQIILPLGLITDFVTDPLTYVPATWISKPLRAMGGLTRATIKTVSPKLADDLSKMARTTFHRSSGIKEFDELRAQGIDAKHFVTGQNQKEVIEINKMIKPLRKENKGLISQLLEEDHEEVFRFVEDVKSGGISPESIEEILGGFDVFRNPDAVRQLIRMHNPQHRAIAVEASRRTAALRAKGIREVEATGRRIPELGGQLKHKEAVNTKRLEDTIRGHFERKLLRGEQFKGRMLKDLETKRQNIIDSVGITRYKQMRAAIESRAEDMTSLVGPGGAFHPEDLAQIMRDYVDSMGIEFLAKARPKAQGQDALSDLYEKVVYESIESLGDSKKVARLVDEAEKIADDIGKTSAWMPHMFTKDGLRIAVEKAPGTFGHMTMTKGGRRLMISPRTQSDIHREFVTRSGRPMSFAEVEAQITSGNYWKTGGARGIPKDYTILDRALQKPAEMGKLLEVDERIVLSTMGERLGRMKTSADWLNRAGEIFGKTAKQVDDLYKAGKLKKWERDGWLATALPDEVTEVMPHLAGLRFDPKLGGELLSTYQRLADPAPVLKVFDTMQNWWKSNTLFLFPWYHTRNMMGNFVNMNLADMYTGPSFGGDISDTIKTMKVQIHNARKNVHDAKGVKFFVKNIDREIDGYEATQLALKNGVIGTGFFGHDIPMDIAMKIDSIWDSPADFVKRIIPGSPQFLGLKAGRAAQEFLENHARFTLFMNRLRKGDGVREASATVKKFLGDYRSEVMNPFERDFVARALPFYRWTRFNVPLQFEQLIMSRGNRLRFMGAMRGLNSANDLDARDLPEETPQWMKEAAGVPVRRNNDTGELEFLIMQNWHPTADIDDFLSFRSIFKAGLTDLTPLIRSPMEFALGRSIFQDRDLKGQEVEFLGRMMDAEFVNMLRNIRMISEFDRLDPFSTFHRVRPDPNRKSQLLRLGGLSLYGTTLERERIGFDKERLQLLRDKVRLARRLLEVEKEEE